MRKYLILILVVLFLAFPLYAVQYYVNSAADDGGDGTTQATTGGSCAWNELSDIAGLSAGDIVSLNMGNEWRERLQVGADGSEGSSITFNAYGSGADPIINGSDLVATWADASPPANSWSATVTTEPEQVFFNGTRGTKEVDEASLSAENEWFWDSNVLYVYSTSDPDNDYTDPGIEAGSRDQCFLILNHEYIDVDEITVKNSNQYGLQNQRGNYINITNLTATYNIDAGIFTQGTVSDQNSYVLIEDCTVSYNIGDGIEVGSYSHYTTIRRVTANNNCTDADTFASAAGIYLSKNPAHAGSTWTNNIVENCTSYSNGVATSGKEAGSGIRYDEFHNGEGHYIRYNLTYDNEGPGIWVENGEGGTIVAYNISHSNTSSQSLDCGIGIRAGIDNQGVKFYNNVMYGNRINLFTGDYSGIVGDTTFDDNEFKNNIMFGATVRELRAVYGGDNGANGSGNIYLNNCLGAESANFIEWGDTNFDSTYDDWETSYGATTASVEADPLMADPSNDIFTLNPHSPCIDRGTDVSLTEDYLGLKIRHVPDIGAYENQTNALFHSVIVTLRIIDNKRRLRWQ